jgi:hypothetical protein
MNDSMSELQKELIPNICEVQDRKDNKQAQQFG